MDARNAKSNSLRTIIIAYIVASLVCVVLYPVRDASFFPMPLQCFLAVTLSISVMRLCDAMHPAAVGSAMAFIVLERKVAHLLLLMIAIIGLLTLVKMLAYIYLEELEFRQFSREFRRSFYGKEVLMSVESNGEDDDVTEEGQQATGE